MTAARPSLQTIFIAAYWDTGRALRAHWRLALLAIVIIFACVMARSLLPRMVTSNLAGQIMLRHGLDIAATVLLAPFLLAILRYVLLGEVCVRYVFEPSRARFQSFCGWLVVFMLVASIPSLLFIATRSAGPIYYIGRAPVPDMKPLFVLLTACVVVLVGFLRTILLLPAVAVDAPGASWQNALEDTGGASWFAGLACLLPLLPVIFMGAVIVPVTSSVPFLRHVVWTLLSFFTVTLLAIVASRLYRAFGERLNRTQR